MVACRSSRLCKEQAAAKEAEAEVLQAELQEQALAAFGASSFSRDLTWQRPYTSKTWRRSGLEVSLLCLSKCHQRASASAGALTAGRKS